MPPKRPDATGAEPEKGTAAKKPRTGATAKPPGREDPVERPPAKYKRGEIVYAPCVQKFGQKPFPAQGRIIDVRARGRSVM